MCLDDLAYSRETAHRAFFRHKERRIDLAVGIVHRHDQIPPLIGEPLMRGPILVQQHANHWAAGPFTPVGSRAAEPTEPGHGSVM